MADDGWVDTTIGDQVLLQRGKDITKREQSEGQVPVVSSGGVSSFHAEAFAGGPGVILGRKGTLGTVFYIDGDFWPHDTTLWVKDFKGNYPRFVYYFFRSMASELLALDVGTANPTLNRNHVHPIDIRWPSLPIQKDIADFLGQLDDKIELNRRMNETLEATARSIFRSWFVDFDPVVAKAEGRQPARMSAETAALFPSAFDGSLRDPLPKGWHIGDVYGIASVTYGAPFASQHFNSDGIGLPLLRIRDLATHQPQVFTPQQHPKGTRVQPGDLVVGMDGEFRAHLWKGPVSWLNQRVCMFQPNPGVPKSFVHFSIEEPLMFFETSKVGTTVTHLGKADIDEFRVIRPPEELLEAFAAVAEPMERRIVLNAQENSTLTAIRDALLPRLLSGEIRLGEAEYVLEEATA